MKCSGLLRILLGVFGARLVSISPASGPDNAWSRGRSLKNIKCRKHLHEALRQETAGSGEKYGATHEGAGYEEGCASRRKGCAT